MSNKLFEGSVYGDSIPLDELEKIVAQCANASGVIYIGALKREIVNGFTPIAYASIGHYKDIDED